MVDFKPLTADDLQALSKIIKQEIKNHRASIASIGRGNFGARHDKARVEAMQAKIFLKEKLLKALSL
jgi:hypothetical protein